MAGTDGSRDDASALPGTAEEEWRAVDEDVGLREEPWWEAEGAPPPHPDDAVWHDGDGPPETPTEHLPSSERGDSRNRGASSGDRGAAARWRSLDETERVAVLAALAVLLAIVLLGGTAVWLLS